MGRGTSVYVSIVIPAHDAGDTLERTIAALQAQSLPTWEAIVVDDASRDDTAAVAARIATADPRVRLLRTEAGCAGVARTPGIAAARHDWLLFLDADDTIHPTLLERLAAVVEADPSVDLVACGWCRIAPDGRVLDEHPGELPADVFASFARTCVFPIHGCLVRRRRVEQVGGFDPALVTCEDWDLWQRLARTGARFAAVPDVLAYYHVRVTSRSFDAWQLLRDGLVVVGRGHGADSRLPDAPMPMAAGVPAAQAPAAKLFLVTWCAGLVIGRGEDARPLLAAVHDCRDPDVDPAGLAASLFEAATLPTCAPPAALWPRIASGAAAYLAALEAHVGSPGLALLARRHLERLIVDAAPGEWPMAVGSTQAVRVEVTAPVEDVVVPPGIERVVCAVLHDGAPLGTIELPAVDGRLTAYVLRDAIAAELAWPLLERTFAASVYPALQIEGSSIRRGGVELASGLAGGDAEIRAAMHGAVGWTVFLQELWGRPAWPFAAFYDAATPDEEAPSRAPDDGWLVVELSGVLPRIDAAGASLDVVPTVGGVPLGRLAVPTDQGRVTPQALRAAVTNAAGIELCRIAAREALVGKPIDPRTPLRARLAAAAESLAEADAGRIEQPALAPTWRGALARAAAGGGGSSTVIGRSPHPSLVASGARRAVLPAAAASTLVDLARASGAPVVDVEGGTGSPRVVYAPDLVWRNGTGAPAQPTLASPSDVRLYDRAHFEALYAREEDPWRYVTPYEETKYALTLGLLPPGRITRALEVGCAEGHFTVQLAPRVGRLLAADISAIAVERAARRCRTLANVETACLDVVRDPLPGRFDLVVASEILYYLGTTERLRAVARKLYDALATGGHLLTAHPHFLVDDPEQAGFDWQLPFGAKAIGEALAATGLRLVHELRTAPYRIQLFRRDSWLRMRWRPPAIVTERPDVRPPAVEIAGPFHRAGGAARAPVTDAARATTRLPILMYHRVAPRGAAALGRYRVTPEAFAEQMAFLADSGWYTVPLEAWRTAVERRQPLPGRAVVITFDDGYTDVAEYAWPVLRRHGLAATTFLVADEIGGSNGWDRTYGESLPLMDLATIRRLRDEGMTFGSHSRRHAKLTALGTAAIVDEVAGSRLRLATALEAEVDAIAYPYGLHDAVVRHLAGASGYLFGLSTDDGLATFDDPLLALPRIEVMGQDTLETFVRRLDPKP
jgi:peptidoglycan/xylan/chitin deacetylase (PgdA/CDA1 family)